MAGEAEQTEEKSGGGMMGKLIAGGVIGVIVLIEAIVAFMMTPDPEAIASKIRSEIKEEEQEGVEDPELLEELDDAETEEVELGMFDVAIHDASSDATYHVSCTVIAAVAVDSIDEFNELFTNNEHRLRERIMIEFRSASPAELNEAGLGLIKRRILEKSNTLIGQPLIRRIILPSYNYHVN